jgi:hypothetical protein
MLFREIIAVNSKPINTFCGHIHVELVNMETGGIYSYHDAVQMVKPMANTLQHHVVKTSE